jgi:diaminopropionate ammonia-lyase
MRRDANQFQLLANPLRQAGALYGDLDRYVGRALVREAADEITAWDGYAPTPLLDWPGLAKVSGVAELRCKYEGTRFGVGSFKALGGAYAAMRAINIRLAESKPDGGLGQITVTTASDGNHGLSVAWGAGRAGCRSVVFLHANVSAERQRLIEAMGAEVQRVAGNYDDSTAAAAKAAAEKGWILVADTSPQFDEQPVRVMAGYGLMVSEMDSQYGTGKGPTHIFLQGGCGGLAASVCGLYRERGNGAGSPVVVVVEPDRAACLYASAAAGKPVVIEGDLDTVMSGLSVGEVSGVAWPVLAPGVDFFMTITDELAIAAMRKFARGVYDAPVEIGDSGVAGIAGFMAANADPVSRARLGIDADSRILVIATEGAVDRASYQRLISQDDDMAAAVASA